MNAEQPATCQPIEITEEFNPSKGRQTLSGG